MNLSSAMKEKCNLYDAHCMVLFLFLVLFYFILFIIIIIFCLSVIIKAFF